MSQFISILAYTPFVTPLPVWDYWMALLLPLIVLFSVGYKAIKCGTMAEVPRETAQIAVLIVLGMIAAAFALWGIVRVMELMV